MEEELISKKELLELTGISYGQLYRWKRKNILPEEWFIHKSAFTGQETFFPKQQVLTRIEKILQMKDDLSLDALAGVFSSIPTDIHIEIGKLIERNIVSNAALKIAGQHISNASIYTFEQTITLYLIDYCLKSGEMSLDESEQMIKIAADHFTKFAGKNCDLILIRKMGVSVFMLVSDGNEISFEHRVKLVLRVNVGKCIEELKQKLITL